MARSLQKHPHLSVVTPSRGGILPEPPARSTAVYQAPTVGAMHLCAALFLAEGQARGLEVDVAMLQRPDGARAVGVEYPSADEAALLPVFERLAAQAADNYAALARARKLELQAPAPWRIII